MHLSDIYVASLQVHKSESVYAVPQLLPQIPNHMRGTQGTGQTVLTAERNNKTYSSNQMETSSITSCENKADDLQTIYSNLGSESQAVATIARERSDSNASGSLIKAPVSLSVNRSGNQTVLTAGKDNNWRTPVFLAGRISDNGNHTTFHKLDSKLATSAEIGNNTKYMNGNELQLPNEDEDELMESDSIMSGLDKKFQEYNVQNQNEFIDTMASIKLDEPICHTIHADNKQEIAMETDCKPQLFDMKAQSLDVLTKNAINANGLAPECVKIIHTVGPKIDLKGIAQELTTTFKPVESAM